MSKSLESSEHRYESVAIHTIARLASLQSSSGTYKPTYEFHGLLRSPGATYHAWDSFRPPLCDQNVDPGKSQQSITLRIHGAHSTVVANERTAM